MFPYLAYRTVAVCILSWNMIGWFRRICAVICVIQAQLVTLLNLYWYYLILKGLKRLLETLGVISKPEGVSYDELEKFEPSANTQLVDADKDNNGDNNDKDNDYKQI